MMILEVYIHVCNTIKYFLKRTFQPKGLLQLCKLQKTVSFLYKYIEVVVQYKVEGEG